MTYAMAAALQEALFVRLSGDTALLAEVGDAIFDSLPAGPLPGIYVTLGTEEVRDRSDATAAGALHLFTVTVVASDAGFFAAKRVAALICDSLLTGAPPLLAQGRIIGLWFERAVAQRRSNGDRSVALRFAARLDAL